MGSLWTSEKISEYHKFMASFISGYKNKIDCADLALEGLVEFAFQEGLPIKLKYYQGKKWHYHGSPEYESFDGAKNPELRDAAAIGPAALAAATMAVMVRNAAKKEEYKKFVRINFGADNVIDNTRKIDPSEARAGDFLMTRRPGAMGHTRVIYSIARAFNQQKQKMDYSVTWYQGTHPPEVPSKQADFLSNLEDGVDALSGGPALHEGKPRVWKFDAFEK